MLPVMADRMRLGHLGECMGLWRAALALGMLWSVHAIALAQKAPRLWSKAAAVGSVQGVRDLIVGAPTSISLTRTVSPRLSSRRTQATSTPQPRRRHAARGQ
jgi:hypothetical protein